jgi:membrane protease YdiL (CAAX protease family)
MERQGKVRIRTKICPLFLCTQRAAFVQGRKRYMTWEFWFGELVWASLFLAVPTALIPSTRRLGAILLALALVLAAAEGWGIDADAAGYHGRLGLTAMIALALLLLAAWAVAPARATWLRVSGHLLFILLAVALSLHMADFRNFQMPGGRLTPDAVPYGWYLNLDKPLIGFWLVMALPWVHPQRPGGAVLRAGVGGWLATSAVCMVLAMGLGMVGWDPKWPMNDALWVVVWLLNNLLLVTFAEEALFRGYIQGGLARLLAGRRHGDLLALCAAALLFGLAHISGGWQWVALAGTAGVGYGLAYRYGGLYAAMCAHFGLNALHLFLFTYPMRDPGASVSNVAAMGTGLVNYFIGFAYN